MDHDSVVLYLSRPPQFLRGHEGKTLWGVAESIARFKDVEFAGTYHRVSRHRGRAFVVPNETLVRDEAERLDVRGPDDVFGGVVPHDFVKTKIITHGPVDGAAARPSGWSDAFADRVRSVVLPGYSAFDRADVREAARRLLSLGRVRAKRPCAAGGRDQRTLTSMTDVESLLEGMTDGELERHGLLLELDLAPVTTLSIGHVTLNDLTISYHGRQSLTRNNHGRWVYGGSCLTCVRGGWDALGRLKVGRDIRTAIDQARVYDEATAEYGVVASRRNYDVGQGVDAAGRSRSGVFEASWRAGGASPAEMAALHVLAGSPAANVVRVSTVEAYGDHAVPPAGAAVHFHGVDSEAGPMVRYTTVHGAAEW
jgi:uncharacterized protein DUF3182